MTMPIDRALTHRDLLGAALGDPSSWSMWLAVFRAAFALDMSDEDRQLFAQVSGDRAPPRRRVRELWANVGRRGGKSRAAALIAIHAALFTNPKLSAGETGVVLCVAMSVEQAGVVFDYCKAALQASPTLAQEIVSITRTEIRLRNGIVIQVVANNFRSTRGRTVVCAIFDECSFWRSDDSAQPDHEVYSAILPSLATVNGMLISISSVYRRVGLMFSKWRDYYAQDSDDTLVVRGTSFDFNPTLDREVVDAQRRADPEKASSEWDSEFRSDLSNLLDEATIEAATNYGRPLELAPLKSLFYKCFVDPSGGRHDAYCISIAHREADTYVVDLVRGTRGAFNPEEVTRQYADLCREYRVGSVEGDNFAAEWCSSAWERCGISYVRAERPKSKIYLEALPLFSRGVIELPDHRILQRELRLLERRVHRSGKDTVDHPRHGSDDHANAALGAVITLAEYLGGDVDLELWRRAWDDNYQKTDPGIERARIAERRFREEVLARICQPPQVPADLLDLIRRCTPKERFTNADPK